MGMLIDKPKRGIGKNAMREPAVIAICVLANVLSTNSLIGNEIEYLSRKESDI